MAGYDRERALAEAAVEQAWAEGLCMPAFAFELLSYGKALFERRQDIDASRERVLDQIEAALEREQQLRRP